MVLFYSIPVGFPVGFYVTSKILDSYFPISSLILGTLLITFCFALLVLLYIHLTNCSISIHPDKIEFHRIFPPKKLITTIPIKEILSIQVKGLGREQQISSDFKFIKINYTQEGLETTRIFRCHGYVNPDPIFNPYRFLIRNHESFVQVRSFLKEICALQKTAYSEHWALDIKSGTNIPYLSVSLWLGKSDHKTFQFLFHHIARTRIVINNNAKRK